MDHSANSSVPNSKAANDNGGTAFWTVCPYCYYMYEYEGMYKHWALRCQNDKCRRAFTAVPIPAAAAPPPEVTDSGKYICLGFVQTGTGSMVDGWKWWHPLVSMVSSSDSDSKEGADSNGAMVVYKPRD